MTHNHIWHPYTKASAVAAGLPVMVRGEGPYLFDEAGTRYLDAVSSWWACSLGHSHPRMVAAIQEQAGILQHAILGNQSHPQALRLAERLSALAGGKRHVHFASDGSCAIEAALKITAQYWSNHGVAGKTTFAALPNPYHGDTLGAVSVGFMEAFHRVFHPLTFATLTLPAPDCGPCDAGRLPGCPAPCADAAVQFIRDHADQLAGVVMEPLCQGAAGMHLYGPGYLRRIAEACQETGVLLIVDEIAMGFYRTGTCFAHQQAGIRPDIVCVGKALSAGMLPISAAIVDDAIYDTFTDHPNDHTFYHGHTFAGNPLAAAAANAALDLYEELAIENRVRELGTTLATHLRPLADSLPHLKVRCLGLIGAVEFDQHDGAQLALRVRDDLLADGILVRPLGNVVYLMPPFILTDQEMDFLLSQFVAAIQDHCFHI